METLSFCSCRALERIDWLPLLSLLFTLGKILSIFSFFHCIVYHRFTSSAVDLPKFASSIES